MYMVYPFSGFPSKMREGIRYFQEYLWSIMKDITQEWEKAVIALLSGSITANRFIQGAIIANWKKKGQAVLTGEEGEQKTPTTATPALGGDPAEQGHVGWGLPGTVRRATLQCGRRWPRGTRDMDSIGRLAWLEHREHSRTKPSTAWKARVVQCLPESYGTQHCAGPGLPSTLKVSQPCFLFRLCSFAPATLTPGNFTYLFIGKSHYEASMPQSR